VVRNKSAFTLIELIFAIVVISITVISLPTMNAVLSKGIEGNIIQESIFAAATKLNEITTAHWDDNSLEPNDIYGFARVIDTTGSLCTNHLMNGHIHQALHRRCLESSITRPDDNANSNADISSLGDYAGSQTFFTSNLSDSSGYKNIDLDINTTIDRNIIFNGTNDPNMKRLTITVTKSATPSTPLIVLKTYSANIGEVDFYKRTY